MSIPGLVLVLFFLVLPDGLCIQPQEGRDWCLLQTPGLDSCCVPGLRATPWAPVPNLAEPWEPAAVLPEDWSPGRERTWPEPRTWPLVAGTQWGLRRGERASGLPRPGAQLRVLPGRTWDYSLGLLSTET